MFKIPTLTRALLLSGLVVGVVPLAQAQVTTDVLVRDGSGNVIANNVHSFDENEAGSGLAVGFVPQVDSTFTFLYQANVVAFNDAAGQPITPALAGLNQSFASGGYEYTVVASITERVTSVTTSGNITSVTFETTGGNASIFFDNTAQGGLQSNTATGNGFDDGKVVGQFSVVAGSGLSNFTTFGSGAGLGATQYDFLVSAAGVDSAFIQGMVGPISDLHFTSSQVLPPGTSTTLSFHNNAPNDGNPDIYPITPASAGLLLKVDGSNTFTAAVPEPETYALMFAGLAAVGFMARRRRGA
jgi:hypothetical protein